MTLVITNFENELNQLSVGVNVSGIEANTQGFSKCLRQSPPTSLGSGQVGWVGIETTMKERVGRLCQ